MDDRLEEMATRGAALSEVREYLQTTGVRSMMQDGLEKVENSKGGKKIPLLGDLPLIGALFREVSTAGGHDKLYIFVKAHILRPGGDLALADLREVSLKNRATFERLETEMQKYEDWPGIKPEPMDPLKILEAD